MKTIEIIGYLAIAVIIVSLFFIGIRFTGYVAVEGVVNVTIDEQASLKFNVSLFDFGSGAVTSPALTAILYSNGTVTDGSWTPTPGELVLENIGNVNVSLTLKTNKTVANFIGGTAGGGPSIQAEVSDTSGHTGACGTGVFDTFAEINTTEQAACDVFWFETADRIDIDFRLVIPNDATGANTVGIVATGTGI